MPHAPPPARSRDCTGGRMPPGPGSAARARPSAASSPGGAGSPGSGAWSGTPCAAPSPPSRPRVRTGAAPSSTTRGAVARCTPSGRSDAGPTSVTGRPARGTNRWRRWTCSSAGSRVSPARFARTSQVPGRSPSGSGNLGRDPRPRAPCRGQRGRRVLGRLSQLEGRDSAAALVAYGAAWSLASRAAGRCFAVCEGMNQVCNAETGFCEPNPCGSGCGTGRHCDIWGPVPRCVDDSMPTDLVRPLPEAPTLPVSTAPP